MVFITLALFNEAARRAPFLGGPPGIKRAPRAGRGARGRNLADLGTCGRPTYDETRGHVGDFAKS